MTSAINTPRIRELPERIRSLRETGQVGRFVLIATQLGLLLILLRVLNIEPGSGLPRLLPLVFAGFMVHSILPLSWRLPFFLMLSLASMGVVLGPLAGAILLLLGLIIVGVCHLPIAFVSRILLLIAIGCALAAMRAGWIEVPTALPSALANAQLPRLVLPVLGSMFMFRLIIYLYDLRHEEREIAAGKRSGKPDSVPQSVWTRLSYFFLLPNVCFLLFPIVDYRTFRRTYYDRDAHDIYERGIWWICLGLTYLLLYRVVYHYLIPTPEEVQGLGGIVRFVVASYLVYLRVVGQFHLITGVLCLFGFNLPPAHHFYLLASGFTDFWRRARIEWKDFMVKIFYYPALVPLQRKLGPLVALIAATVVVFVATWLLHAYQWFWLRGDFRLSTNDTVFWTIIGTCVLANSLLEMRRARRKTAPGFAPGRAIVHALRVVGMFVFMCVLWSYWSSPSFAIWISYLTAVEESGIGAYLIVAAGLSAVVGAGVLAQFIAARIGSGGGPARGKKQQVGSMAWRPAAVMSVAAVLLLTSVAATNAALKEPFRDVVATLGSNRLNEFDQEREDRGYYEALLDEPRSTVSLLAVSNALESKSSPELSTAIEEETPTDPPGRTGEQAVIVDSLVPMTGVEKRTATETVSQLRGEARGDSSERATPTPSTATPRKDAGAPTKSSSRLAIDSAVVLSALSNNATKTAEERFVGRRLRRYERMTNDLTLWENAPNFSGNFKWAPIRTNQWGMRDREYALAPPPHTYRIALLGSSMTVGAGVPVEQTMETLIEERLNREGPKGSVRNFEILNFSVGAYGIMQNAALMDSKVFAFSPDAVMLGIFSVDATRMVDYLTKLARAGPAIPYPYVRAKLIESGVRWDMEVPELRRRLKPLAEDMVIWSYQRILEACRKHGVPLVGIVLPEPTPKADGRDINKSARLAAAAGITLLDLRGIYEGQSVDSLQLAVDGDPHWNARGHKLIAERVFELLREHDARYLKLGFSKKVN